MKLLRNDDVIIVDGVVYQFKQLDNKSDAPCPGCAFHDMSCVICNSVHCMGETRIDQLSGHFKKI